MEVELAELRSQLKNSESHKAAIAKLAKDILENDKDKDRRLSALGEENLQQSRDIARLQSLLKARDDYLIDVENEVSKLRNKITKLSNNKSAYMVELEQKISSLRGQITENNALLSDQGQELQELKKKLAAKEKELEEALKNAQEEISIQETADSFSDFEKTKLNKEINELKLERSLMLDEISHMQEKEASLSRDLINERSRSEELSALCDGYKINIEELRQRCSELTSELDDCRSNTKLAKKGNSMFYEFVDERVKLEKDLLKLKAQNDFLVGQRDAYECELNELRHELILALTLRTGEGNSGCDTSMLQQEISRLRTELATVNAKLLQKCEETVKVETKNDFSAAQAVDFKECAFNSMKEEVKRLVRKLDIAQKERAQYFDKSREYEGRYLEECRRSRELLDEVACLKKRLAMQQMKTVNNAVAQNLKPSKEKLSEKIANINKIDAGDPTISEGLNSFALTSYSSVPAKCDPSTPFREAFLDVVSGTKTSSAEPVDDIDVSKTSAAQQDAVGQKDEDDDETPVEKRLKFQLPDEETWPSMMNRNKENVPPARHKQKRKIMKKVCEVAGL